MVDHTLTAVMRQTEAMSCGLFRIGIYDRKGNRMIFRHGLSEKQVISAVPSLKYQNLNGKDIFVGCDKSVDRALILVDDLDAAALSEMKTRGMNPACVTETSPGNFQAWVSLGAEPMEEKHKKIAARLLAREFRADPASTDAWHLGRLAGYTNKKPKYETERGYPYVLCREWEGRHAAKSKELRAWAIWREKQDFQNNGSKRSGVIPIIDAPVDSHQEFVFSKYYSQWEAAIAVSGKKRDISRGDFAVICRMIKEGYSNERIFIETKNQSPDIDNRKLNHIDDYIERTIAAAYNYINNGYV
jgi:hypothetical protein